MNILEKLTERWHGIDYPFLVHSTGALIGNIKTPVLNIKEGAQFKGKCNMTVNLKKISKTRKKRVKFFLAG